jgi:uncharacterized protein with HEPN domain
MAYGAAGMSDSSETALPSVTDRFGHIVSMIHEVQAILSGISRQELIDDWRKRMALERMLEIISVASEHIPAKMKATETDVDWQAIAHIGKRLENTRDRIEAEVLWTISHDKLLSLKSCSERHRREQHNEPSS